ncbi:hypothetical protein FA95DRAFT_236496 [Auriscalpium vulgare]|uniref:Uncharacterized protein n=1 Tax=Auriscalpium vulgare TaxID=40419 RepID=A0ACB8S4Y5_9AGAM|nr:hypothetical protein FA95DRAFT_236496 [Auriscalpium vulgare]
MASESHTAPSPPAVLPRELTEATMYDPTDDAIAATARVGAIVDEARDVNVRDIADNAVASAAQSITNTATRAITKTIDRALTAIPRPSFLRADDTNRTAVATTSDDDIKEKGGAEIQEEPVNDLPAAGPTSATTPEEAQVDNEFSDYVNLMFQEGVAPPRYKFLAGLFTWTLLGGFIVLPGTYTTLQTLQENQIGGQTEQKAIKAALHVPLFAVAWSFAMAGAVGMCWLWYKLRKSYVWLCDRLFWPGALNGLMGLLSTIVTIFSAEQGELAASGTTTIAITGSCMVICTLLGIFYTVLRAREVKKNGRYAGFKLDGKGLLKAAVVRWEEADDHVGVLGDLEKQVKGVSRRGIRNQARSFVRSSIADALDVKDVEGDADGQNGQGSTRKAPSRARSKPVSTST